MKKEVLVIFFVVVYILALSTVFAEDQILIKFHSEGEGKNISINLNRFFPSAVSFYHSEVKNVAITIRGGIAVVVPNENWKGDEIIVFSPNASLAKVTEISKSLNVTNIEPVIEMSFPDLNNFVAAPGTIDFNVAVFDSDNDLLEVEWLLNNVSMKKESERGGIISTFSFNQTSSAGNLEGIILRNENFSNDKKVYVITVVINDSKNAKSHDWRFNVINASCIDNWACGNWSECIDGKHYRNCLKRNPTCVFNMNRPSTEWIDPGCATPSYCDSNWSCGEWGICTINYNTRIITNGVISDSINTKQERICEDANYCIGSVGIERRECKESVPINTKVVNWCFDKYIEIYNADNGLLLSRIRQSKIENQGIDIDLSLTDLAKMRRCWYCFDGILDYDETDVDCGGSSCEECLYNKIDKDYIADYKTIIMIGLDVLLVFALVSFLRK